MLLPNRVGLLVQGMVRVGLVQKGMEAEGLKSTLSATALERAKSSWRSLCQFQRQTFFFFLAPPNMALACSHVGVVPRRPRPQNAVPMGATSCPWRRRRRRRRPLARGRKRRRRRDLAAPSKRRGGAGSPSRPVGAARSEEQGGGPGGPATPGKEQEPGKERT